MAWEVFVRTMLSAPTGQQSHVDRTRIAFCAGAKNGTRLVTNTTQLFLLLEKIGDQALVYAVRVGDNPTLGGLSEHFCKPNHRHGAGRDDVRQHLARPTDGS